MHETVFMTKVKIEVDYRSKQYKQKIDFVLIL